MTTIKYRFSDGTTSEIEVTEEFAAEYAETEHKEYLINRKETRRHQSLDKSLEHGFDIADPTVNISEEVERRELAEQLKFALHTLTNKQRAVFLSHALDELSFREIGERLNIGTAAVFDHYQAAIKKLKKFFEKYPKNNPFRGY